LLCGQARTQGGMHHPTRPKEVLTQHLISLKIITKMFLYCTLKINLCS